MARWQRDPRSRRLVAGILAGIEVVALTGTFLVIAEAYLLRLFIRMGQADSISIGTFKFIVYTLTGLACIAALVEAVLYVRGRSWVRKAFMAQNVVLIVMGVAWFALSQMHAAGASPEAAQRGLLLPVITLFPLLWPLIEFKGPKVPGQGQS